MIGRSFPKKRKSGQKAAEKRFYVATQKSVKSASVKSAAFLRFYVNTQKSVKSASGKKAAEKRFYVRTQLLRKKSLRKMLSFFCIIFSSAAFLRFLCKRSMMGEFFPLHSLYQRLSFLFCFSMYSLIFCLKQDTKKAATTTKRVR
jgi:hypothetical protein